VLVLDSQTDFCIDYASCSSSTSATSTSVIQHTCTPQRTRVCCMCYAASHNTLLFILQLHTHAIAAHFSHTYYYYCSTYSRYFCSFFIHIRYFCSLFTHIRLFLLTCHTYMAISAHFSHLFLISVHFSRISDGAV
jgi:hypothetical protein